MNPYEEAVKWIEEEVRKNGVFSIRAVTHLVDIDGSKCYRPFPDGHIAGFTVSSQHTQGNDWNILQLVNTMKRLEKELPARREEEDRRLIAFLSQKEPHVRV